MFDFLFITSILIFVFYEIYTITNPGWPELFKKRQKRYPQRYKTQGCFVALITILYFVWTFVGIAFATNWIPFAAILGLSLLHGLLNKTLPEIFPFYRVLEGTVTLILILYIFFSHYHPQLFF
jgi:hypothetical protein